MCSQVLFRIYMYLRISNRRLGKQCIGILHSCLFICHSSYFSNNPMTISIELQFDGQVNIAEYQQKVAGIIFEDAPRYRYLNSIGHLVGDLLIFYDSWNYILHGAEANIYSIIVLNMFPSGFINVLFIYCQLLAEWLKGITLSIVCLFIWLSIQ